MADVNVQNEMNQHEFEWRERSRNSDENVVLLVRRIVRAYYDMGLLGSRDLERSNNMTDEEVVNKIISKVPELNEEQRLEFADRFVGDATDLDRVPPSFLASAYRAIRARAGSDTQQQERLNRVAARIDELAEMFHHTGAMVVDSEGNVVSGTGLNTGDFTNIYDVYDGYNEMFQARMEDVADDKKTLYQENLDKTSQWLNTRDEMYGLDNFKPEDAPRVEAKYDKVVEALAGAELTEENKRLLNNYKFLDKDGNVIPQYLDENGQPTENYAENTRIDRSGRLARVIDFARSDTALRHAARVDEEIQENDLDQEFNRDVLFKLYQMDVADKVTQGALEAPDQFTDPAKLQEFVDSLGQVGGRISDKGYEAAVKSQVNNQVGFFSRIKKFAKDKASKLKGFFNKGLDRIKPVDPLSQNRMKDVTVDKHAARIEFLKRILKGVASAFIVSALITAIATAGAAVMGMSFAASLAIVGVMSSIALTAIQIHKWRKAREKMGIKNQTAKEELRDFLKDKRMVSSIAVTGLAAVSMAFGAAGLTAVAQTLGLGALTLGAGKRAVETFNDAKHGAKMSTAESLGWSIANALAVAGGAMAGRYTAHAAMNAYDDAHPDNEIFQDKHTEQYTEEQKNIEDKWVDTQDGLDGARRIVNGWYADDPGLLQQRVDAIEAYNMEHGTNIDPYRALMISHDAGMIAPDNDLQHIHGGTIYSHGNHYVLTPEWAATNDVPMETIHSASQLFDGVNSANLNSDSMAAIQFLDGPAPDGTDYINSNNTIGRIDGYGDNPDGFGWQDDKVLGPDNVEYDDGHSGHSVAAEGPAAHEWQHIEHVEQIPHERTTFERLYHPGMGVFGNYDPKIESDKVLADRVGAFADTIKRETDKPRDTAPLTDDVPITEDGPVTGDIDKFPPRQLGDGRTPVAGLLPEGRGEDKPIERIGEKPIAGLLGEGQKQDTPQRGLTNGETSIAGLLGEGGSSDKTYDDDLVFGMDYNDAKRHQDYIETLERYKKERQNNNGGRIAEKLEERQTKLEQKIRELENKLGNPNKEEIERAKAEAFQRHKIEELLKAYQELKKRKITDERTAREVQDGMNSIQRQIVAMGGIEQLDTSNLVFYKPVKGVGRQQKDLRNGGKIPADSKPVEEVEYGEAPREIAGRLDGDEIREESREAMTEQKTDEVDNVRSLMPVHNDDEPVVEIKDEAALMNRKPMTDEERQGFVNQARATLEELKKIEEIIARNTK